LSSVNDHAFPDSGSSVMKEKNTMADSGKKIATVSQR
jgi:hypothetical protein